jgi:hypothetical protein
LNQVYRESNLELSNIRSNDQLVPCPQKENLLKKQIDKKFPANHPLTSQISYKKVFPNFTAPENSTKGEQALTTSIAHNQFTPAQVDNTIVVNKISGKPYRHEIRYLNQPGQANGLWYYDKEYYHVNFIFLAQVELNSCFCIIFNL